jgi:spectinomycin phosphotransferase
MAHQATIHMVVASLEKLAGALQKRPLPYVVCHADLHPANLLRDQAGHVFVIDWDEVMLAPKERDFLFIKDVDDSTPDIPPFFQGYGQTEIDWIALTYYRYERVMQDLIACAQDVCFRDDLGEQTRTDAVRLFQEVLSEGGEIDTARAAATHLPFDLIAHTRENS